VWFSGIPFALGNNPLLVPILRAPAESFASDSDSDTGADAVFDAAERSGEGLWAGSTMGIVTGFQTRDNNARITWVGGVELFSDAYARKLLPSYVKLSLLFFVWLTQTRFFFSLIPVARSPEMNNLRVTLLRGRSRKILFSALIAPHTTL
jgi:hypothetical protein